MSERHTPVLVVGGSLVGLSMSALLAEHGVPHLLVEGHVGTAIHPRAASFHQRTMEIFRSIGLQEEVEEAAAREFAQGGAIVAVESVAGRELQYFFRSYNEGVEGLSPTSRLFITQVGLEPILRRRAGELGAEHRFGTELVSFARHDDHVRSVIRPSGGGSEDVVTSDYLVAADGAQSTVRQRLGIPMTGRGSFADCITIYFRANVKPLLRDRNLSVVYVNHPKVLGFFRFSFTGDAGFLAVFATFGEDGTRDANVAEDTSTARCVELVRTALGDANLPVEVESVQPWQASAATAERFQQGRVFLAGDAAHVMPPTGGFGGNTGVADAHNLAWKLALATRGAARAGLLETYDGERRPIGALTVEQAYTRYVLRVDPSLPQSDLMPALDDPSIELGSIYRSGAVVPDAIDHRQLDDPRARAWTVGARVPHLLLADGGRQSSTLDTVGTQFALFCSEREDLWGRAAADVGRALGVPIAVRDIATSNAPEGPSATDGGAEAVPAAALVRPDGVLAWKAGGTDDEGPQQLRHVMSAILAAEPIGVDSRLA
jgi:2-polyprenyl-6-methoxyphenol hydroxylase-like FAD-dependent oxidoreductase